MILKNELDVLLRIEDLLADRLPNPHTEYKLAEVECVTIPTPVTNKTESADNLLSYYKGLVAEYRDVFDQIKYRLDAFNRRPYEDDYWDVVALVSDLRAILNGESVG